jgi:hypothetical protein
MGLRRTNRRCSVARARQRPWMLHIGRVQKLLPQRRLFSVRVKALWVVTPPARATTLRPSAVRCAKDRSRDWVFPASVQSRDAGSDRSARSFEDQADGVRPRQIRFVGVTLKISPSRKGRGRIRTSTEAYSAGVADKRLDRFAGPAVVRPRWLRPASYSSPSVQRSNCQRSRIALRRARVRSPRPMSDRSS